MIRLDVVSAPRGSDNLKSSVGHHCQKGPLNAPTVAEAVEVMGRIQLGRLYRTDETAKILAFLKTLTGEQPQFVLPMLPPSADTTPRTQGPCLSFTNM